MANLLGNILGSFKSNPSSSASIDSKFGIDAFAAEIGKNGIARSSYFLVQITCPQLKDFTGLNGLALRVEQVNMPARQMLTIDQNYYGPPRKIPYRFISQPVSMTIIMSEDMREREFFMQWQDLFVGSMRQRGGLPGAAVYDCGYFKENVGTMEIKHYAESPAFQGQAQKPNSLLGDIKDAAEAFGFNTSKVTNPFGINLFGLNGKVPNVNNNYNIKLVDAYPSQVQDIQLNWGDEGYAKLQVEMTYTYVEEHHPFTDAGTQAGKSFLRKGLEAFQRFKPVFSLVKGQGLGGAIKGALSSTGQGELNAGRAIRKILPF